tara:strand:- start:3684 stop:3974 length:291 start_codon:yes stop_codon:yes gene_type:complete
MIKKFRDMMEDDNEIIDIDSLMTDEERAEYDKWLDIFKTITPYNVPLGIDKIIDTIETTRSDGVILLAYIKFFEERLKEMATEKKDEKDYEGSMFG